MGLSCACRMFSSVPASTHAMPGPPWPPAENHSIGGCPGDRFEGYPPKSRVSLFPFVLSYLFLYLSGLSCLNSQSGHSDTGLSCKRRTLCRWPHRLPETLERIPSPPGPSWDLAEALGLFLPVVLRWRWGRSSKADRYPRTWPQTAMESRWDLLEIRKRLLARMPALLDLR